MPLPFSSPSSLPSSPLPRHLHSMLNDQVSLGPSGERERRRRWVALINGRKLDDGMERRETDRPHNLPYQDIAITSLSFSLCISPSLLLLCVIQTHRHTNAHKQCNTVQTPHANTHLTTNMLQKNTLLHLNSRIPTLCTHRHMCKHTHTIHK